MSSKKMTQSVLSLLLLLIFAILIQGTPRKRRLAGGVNADNEQFPFMAAVKYNNKLVCGGAIISPNKILTAANCFWCKNQPLEECAKNLTVQTGSANLFQGGNLNRVKKIKIADGFRTGKFANDIAIVTLESEIKFSANEKAVNLPDKDIEENAVGISSGWGVQPKGNTLSSILASIEEKIISASECFELFSKNTTNSGVDTNDFCAAAVDGTDKAGLCAGDSGNPLVLDGKVIGVSTWGIGCRSGFPDVFSNVYRHLEFIKNELYN